MAKTNLRSPLGLGVLAIAAAFSGGCDRDVAAPVPQGSDGGLGRLGAPSTLDDDPRVAKFKLQAASYLAMRAQLRPLEQKFSSGTITETEVETWRALDASCSAERHRLNTIMYDQAITPDQRRAMFWVLRQSN
ncbi:MAG: hypothetical protein QMB94_12650 [Phycisphaerales bacterium]